jgi:hypothetical protein
MQFATKTLQSGKENSVKRLGRTGSWKLTEKDSNGMNEDKIHGN